MPALAKEIAAESRLEHRGALSVSVCAALSGMWPQRMAPGRRQRREPIGISCRPEQPSADDRRSRALAAHKGGICLSSARDGGRARHSSQPAPADALCRLLPPHLERSSALCLLPRPGGAEEGGGNDEICPRLKAVQRPHTRPFKLSRLPPLDPGPFRKLQPGCLGCQPPEQLLGAHCRHFCSNRDRPDVADVDACISAAGSLCDRAPKATFRCRPRLPRQDGRARRGCAGGCTSCCAPISH